MPCLLPALLLAYLIARASLGTLLNPPLNGPDEAGHVEYVRTLAESGGRQVTGVEANQPPLYYAIAAVLWKLATPLSTEARLVVVRQLSVAAGAASLLITWHAARLRWPAHPLLAMAAAMLAALVPGHLYLLASISNDPPAEALAGLVVLLALRLAAPPDATPHVGQQGNLGRQRRQGEEGGSEGQSSHTAPDSVPPQRRQGEGKGSEGPGGDRVAGATGAAGGSRRGLWLAWTGAAAAAMATKYTTAPVIAGTAAALAWHYRHDWSRRRWARAGAAAALLAGLVVYGRLLLQHPTSSFAAAAAHFWLQALARAPFAYVRLGGLAESFRSFWYAYDFAVRWPRPLELALAVPAAAAMAVAFAALIGAAALQTERRSPSGPAGALVLWLAAAAQAAFVVGRFGFGDLLHAEMGGAAQAKAFFPALLPLALLTTEGLAAAWRRLTTFDTILGGLSHLQRSRRPASTRWEHAGLAPRWGLLLLFGWLVLLDLISTALTLWHHYRWLQVGMAAW